MQWGRKEYPSWPSRKPVWILGALWIALMVFALGLWVDYARNWSFAEKVYLPIYVKTWIRGSFPNSKARYSLLKGVTAKKRQQIFIADEAEEGGTDASGQKVYRLTEEGTRGGIVGLVLDEDIFNDRPLHDYLRHWVYHDQRLWDYIKRPSYEALIVLAALLWVAVPKERQRLLVLKHGRRLRGPELVRTTEFNSRHEADGMAFVNEEQTLLERLFQKNASRWVRLPRQREAMHFLVMGDSGAGKSAIIRQILSQIWDRGEAAIVYDPAMEFLPQYYSPERGDVILNPLDARCPFWTPGDEVPHEAEALTFAASLFPDQGRENRFFVDAPRKIFAHLLNLRPTPEELTYWMSHEEEIDRRVKGTEMAVMIAPHAATQRNGVLASLNLVADAFKMLPRESETKRRWSTVEWAKERKGWIFLTSKATMRERARPLMSLWLDLLVLRLMNEGHSGKKPVWFVLDELASLQRLPQLTTAITENRKSNNPMVLGLQGKAQLETIYGHISEVLLSQPATKIYLKTGEPNSAEWISKAIGEIEIERFRETRTQGQFPRGRNSESAQRDIQKEALVMASEISGLDPLHAYLKYGNLVVRMRVPYMELADLHKGYIERQATEIPKPQSPAPVKPVPELPVSPPPPKNPPANEQGLFFE